MRSIGRAALFGLLLVARPAAAQAPEDMAIRHWAVLASFPADTAAAALDSAWVPGEAGLRPGASPVRGVAWRAATADAAGRVDLLALLRQRSLDRRVAYAVAWVRSPGERTADLAVESDDDVAVWLNGVLVHRHVVDARGPDGSGHRHHSPGGRAQSPRVQDRQSRRRLRFRRAAARVESRCAGRHHRAGRRAGRRSRSGRGGGTDRGAGAAPRARGARLGRPHRAAGPPRNALVGARRRHTHPRIDPRPGSGRPGRRRDGPAARRVVEFARGAGTRGQRGDHRLHVRWCFHPAPPFRR